MTNQEEFKPKKVEDIKKETEERRCPVQKSLYYIENFLADSMCGKCFPCAYGTYEAKIRLRDIISGIGSDADIAALRRIAEDMIESSRCKRGKDSATFLLEWMNNGSFTVHVEKKCPDRECLELTEYFIIPEKCIMCGECTNACKFAAIIGEKMKPYQSGYLPFEILQKRCTRCGECIKVCPTNAIEFHDFITEDEVMA
jgi:ferredoxin